MMCSCSFGFVLLGAVSSNPPPPSRLLPVTPFDEISCTEIESSSIRRQFRTCSLSAHSLRCGADVRRTADSHATTWCFHLQSGAPTGHIAGRKPSAAHITSRSARRRASCISSTTSSFDAAPQPDACESYSSYERCGSNSSGLLGVPLRRISKYSSGAPCGPLPMSATRWPALTESPSPTTVDWMWP